MSVANYKRNRYTWQNVYLFACIYTKRKSLGILLDFFVGSNCGLKYNIIPVGPSTKIEIAIAIICNNAERNGKRKSRVAFIDFRGIKVYSKLKCANKLVPIGESILSRNWINRLSYKGLKTSPAIEMVSYL